MKNKLGTEYIPKNILLTGGAGFIGSHVLASLVNYYPDCKIVCIDKLDYCSSRHAISYLDERSNYIFVEGDILDAEKITQLLETHKIDTILHFAAQTHVDNSFGNSLNFTKVNTLGTHVLLECCRQYKNIRRFIHVSTDEVYGETAYNDIGVIEESILRPTNPYAASKAAAEHLVVSYSKSFQLPIIIVRCNNVYGPNQFPEKLIPKFILRLLNNEKCCIHGKGDTKRSFIHVYDVVSAYMTILKYGVLDEVYNIQSDDELSVKQVTLMLLEYIKPNENPDDWIEYTKDRPFNDERYNINGTKLLNLGWEAIFPFKDGLIEVCKWYETQKKNGNILALWPPKDVEIALKPQ